jgi:hypothetical protein
MERDKSIGIEEEKLIRRRKKLKEEVEEENKILPLTLSLKNGERALLDALRYV